MKFFSANLVFAVVVFFSVNAQYENSALKVGQKAPELAYANPDGKTLQLSEINKGRFVLIHFWASWTGPGRIVNPAILRMYKDFSAKKFKGAKNGFTILSFSLDSKKEAWVAAIHKDNLVWPYHMSDLNPVQWKSAVVSSYGVQFLPQAFLVDPKGLIVGKYQRPDEAEADLGKFVMQ